MDTGRGYFHIQKQRMHTFQAGVPELHGLFWIYLKSKNYTNLRNYGGVIHMARIAGVDLPREKRV